MQNSAPSTTTWWLFDTNYIATKRHGPHCALLSWPNLTTLHCTLNDCYVNSDLFVCKKNRNGFPNSSIDLISSPVRALGCTSSICNFMYNLLKSFLKEYSSFHEPAFLQNIHTIEIIHCWYIEPWNREKSLTLIWQRFSCLLDEWIAKI